MNKNGNKDFSNFVLKVRLYEMLKILQIKGWGMVFNRFTDE